MSRFQNCLLIVFLSTLLIAHSSAQSFDLAGPKVDVRVQRTGKTLPIAEVPNLLPGDRLWVHPDFPDSQSAHYVLIVAFLRGATNPPPPEWFTRVDTWTREVREEGVFVVVPEEAQQALVFLAPESGGDFSTLRQAVRGRPGAFVRATQDLQQASWDRLRLDAYLDGVKQTALHQPLELKDRTARMARTLGVKLDKECFDKPTEQQAPCLVQHTDGLVLDDANSHSMVEQLTTGSTMDLVNQIGSTPLGGGGMYGAYVGAIVDVVRIFGSMHTAHFQYIPALALPIKDTMNLRLNTPPSFRAPKSVLVVALPPVGPGKTPVLLPTAPTDEYCAQKSELVLPCDGAPLIFASSLGRELVLHVETVKGPLDIPLKVDPGAGGLVLQHKPPVLKPNVQTAVVRGRWGFDAWEGPHYRLHTSLPQTWKLAPGDQTALILGRDDTLHLVAESEASQSTSPLCVESVEKLSPDGSLHKLTWKAAKPDGLEIVVPMKAAPADPAALHETTPEVAVNSVTLNIRQYGLDKPDSVQLKAYAEAASLERLTLSVGDTTALLKGTRLDEVAQVELAGVHFAPLALSRLLDADQLALKADNSTSSLESTKRYTARVELHDGRQLKVPVTVQPQRPQLTLRSKGVQFEETVSPSPVRLGTDDDLPVNGRLVFFLESKVPHIFPRNQKVEVAAVDGSYRTVLSLTDSSLMLEDAHTALGVVEPLARFGSSAFGPIQLRAVSAEGVTGDWISLGTLVRLPGFKELRCPRSNSKPCLLSGTNLFLIAEVSAQPGFESSVEVPSDFTGTQLSVPHGTGGTLYLRLRDDRSTIQTLALPVEVLPTAQVVALPAATTEGNESRAGQAAESPSEQTEKPAADHRGGHIEPVVEWGSELPALTPPHFPLPEVLPTLAPGAPEASSTVGAGAPPSAVVVAPANGSQTGVQQSTAKVDSAAKAPIAAVVPLAEATPTPITLPTPTPSTDKTKP